jgi:hypothetical protein
MPNEVDYMAYVGHVPRLGFKPNIGRDTYQ